MRMRGAALGLALLPSLALASGAEDMPLGEKIIHHVANGPALVPISLGGLDMSITKHVLMMWVSAAIVLALMVWYARRVSRSADGVPQGNLAHIVDFFVEYIHRQVVQPLLGEPHAAAWTPMIVAFFFFILTCNLLGLTPLFDWLEGSTTATGNFNVTAGLALVTFSAIILAGSIAHGVVGHWKNLVPHGLPWPVYIILIPIELLGMFVKPFALTMRLAANMTAGHIAVLAIFSVIFIFKSAFVGVLAVPLVLGLMLLEIIVCFVQAYVFTLLSTVFIGMAVKAHH